MKCFICLAAVLAVTIAKPKTGISKVELKTQWEEYKQQYSKTFVSSEEEYRRYRSFEKNVLEITQHNEEHAKGIHSFSMGIHEYSDMSISEIRSKMNGYLGSDAPRNGSKYLSPSFVQIPDTVDWRTKGFVTPVKNQGQCGSCWAFSSTGSLEGQHYRATGKLVSLSEQNLVDCTRSFGNYGCGGGWMDNAFRYVKVNGGIDTERSYPYDAVDEKCHYRKQDRGATDTGFVDIPEGDEQALKEAVATVGPVSIAIDAAHSSFMNYRSGVYVEPNCSTTLLDHGVLIVGYGTEDGRDYWLVKNSWGESWGDEGYIKMGRNMDNQCGVASKASYPLV